MIKPDSAAGKCCKCGESAAVEEGQDVPAAPETQLLLRPEGAATAEAAAARKGAGKITSAAAAATTSGQHRKASTVASEDPRAILACLFRQPSSPTSDESTSSASDATPIDPDREVVRVVRVSAPTFTGSARAAPREAWKLIMAAILAMHQCRR